MASFDFDGFDLDAFDAGSFDLGAAAHVQVSWLEFDSNATPVDVQVSWLELDTQATPVDVRVSWLEFDSNETTPAGNYGFEMRYVRRGKKLHLFRSTREADEWLAAEEAAQSAIAQAKTSSRGAKRRIKQRLSQVSPVQSIDTDALGQMLRRFDVAFDLPALLAQQSFDLVMQMHALALQLQDDEDIELLLLSL